MDPEEDDFDPSVPFGANEENKRLNALVSRHLVPKFPSTQPMPAPWRRGWSPA